ncbi:DgyrCDS10284 [Dimorphilus gyrociliatus]|uniref:DgyrCDS10284 n=1 Tax=Dimorphilus gyrociliatus TaxID=2664684 RepID=A0A7I8W151_9ANNE|nr:DgyrCDS10284 [Dimorphilus gyrociliatus]
MTLFPDVEEEESDNCFSQLFGTAGYTHCSFGDNCLNMLIKKGGKEYVITHQVLLGFIIKMESCTNIEHQLLEKGIHLEKHMNELCTNNFFEVATSVRLLRGKIPAQYRDLFMEQIFVCPSYGYTHFLHTYFLKQIMSWQHSSGCFGTPDSVMSEKNTTAIKNMRRLLEEKELPNGCMSHESGVACGALVVFLRFLIEHPQSSDSSFNNLLEHSLTTNVKLLTEVEEQPVPKIIGQDYTNEEKKESNNDQDYHQYMDIDDPRRSDIRQELQRDASLRQRSYKNRSDSIHLFIFLLAIIPSLILLFRFIRSRRIVILYPARFW